MGKVSGFEQLYAVHAGSIHGALHLRARTPFADAVAEPRALLDGTTKPKVPLVLEHFLGGRARDIITTDVIDVKAFSDRVIDLLRGGEFTGWTTYPVEIYGKGGEGIDGYHGLAVTGRCGPIDDSLSPLEWRPPPCEGGRRMEHLIGLFFDMCTWDGSDIFLPEGCTLIIVTERVKIAFEKAKVKNCEFTRLTEFERLPSF